MSWTGTGTFNRLYSWVADKAAGLDITASRFDADTDDITSNGFGNCLTRDGQGQPTGNLPMANFRHTGVGNGVSRTDYAALGQLEDGLVNWAVAAGTSDAITVTYAPAITALVDGQICWFRASAANTTTTPTFKPNGVTAETITKTGGHALVVGDISGNLAEVGVRYNLANTRWELLNPPAFPAGGQLEAADGTVSAPGIAFNSEAGTGLYRIGAGHVGFAILGVEVVDITATTFSWLGATVAGADLSPASFSTEQDNYSPTGLASASCLRLDPTAACSLTGIAGGAAGRELELINIGAATLQCPANSSSSLAANRFANTFNLAPGQSVTLRYDATSSLWRPKNIATAFSSCALAVVSNDLLIKNDSTNPNTVIDITCGEAVLTDSSGNAIKFEAVSVTANSGTSGAGGLDTGPIATSTAYFLWLISDGVTINALISLSSSAPTMPTNYIYKKRIGGTFTDGSSNFLRVRQQRNLAQYVIGTNPAISPVMASGTAGTFSTTSPTLATISVVGFIPSTAVAINISYTSDWKSSSAPGQAIIAPNVNYGGSNNGPEGTNGMIYPFWNSGVIETRTVRIALEGTTIAWASSNGVAGIACMGWEDNI